MRIKANAVLPPQDECPVAKNPMPAFSAPVVLEADFVMPQVASVLSAQKEVDVCSNIVLSSDASLGGAHTEQRKNR